MTRHFPQVFRKFGVAIFFWLFVLAVIQFASGGLNITAPGVNEEMKRSTMYTYQGGGAIDNDPGADAPVIVRLYQDDPPTAEFGSNFDDSISSNHLWIMSAVYSSPASDDGLVVVTQSGNDPASVTVDWNNP